MNNLIHRCPITLQLTVTIPFYTEVTINFCTEQLIRYRNSNCQFKARKSTQCIKLGKYYFLK